MKTKREVFTSFAVLFSVCLFVIASTLQVGAQRVPTVSTNAVGAPTFRVGDFWKYQYLNKKGGFAQTIIEVNNNGVVLSSTGGKRVTFSLEGNLVSGYGPETGKLVTFNPAIPRLQFPLWVGKQWSISYTAYSGSWSEDATLDVKVVSMESITTSAGAFETLKLELRFSTGNQELCWYAESVKRFVKCEYTNPGRSYELETFRLGPLLGAE